VADNPTREELDDIIAEHQPRLKSFISQRVKSAKDAEDILQDVLYQFVKTVDDSVTPIEHISAWLYRVARNTIINAGIRKKEESLPYYTDDEGESYLPEGFSDILSGDEAAPSPETEYLRSLVWVELEEALSELAARTARNIRTDRTGRYSGKRDCRVCWYWGKYLVVAKTLCRGASPQTAFPALRRYYRLVACVL
jgi:RNA polymerase sigma factor (sigma-70 family)